MRLLTGLFLFFLCESIFSQQYTIKGKIYDAQSKEPIPFASVILKGTTVGTNTDFDGNFSLTTDKISDSLIALYIGYQRVAVPLKRGVNQSVNIPFYALQEGISLNEIVVKAGENPAHRIIRLAIAHKIMNDKARLKSYQYEVYNKIEFDLNNIPKKLKDNKAFKPIKFIFNNMDSVNSDEKPSLPLFMVETMSDIYYKNSPKTKKEVIKASKISGIQNQSVSQVMGDMYQNIDIYDNDLIVFGKNFKSPLADNAIFNYKFYLEDSVFLENKWCYHIRFKPRRQQELCFSGNMWIADTTFGVKRLEMSIPTNTNINFINAASVIQEFVYTDSVWMLKKDRIVIDFIPSMAGIINKKKQPGIYGRKTTSYTNIITNKMEDIKITPTGNNIFVEDSATKRSNAYWDTMRHDSLTNRENKIYKMIDTIQGLRFYKRWSEAVTIMVSGYYKAGNFEIGPLYKFYSNNVVEGSRLRFGGRTSSKFSRWHELNGYVAYGTKDQKWKYGLGFKAFLSKKPRRQLIGMDYKSDLELLGQSQNGFTNDNLFATFLRRASPRTLTRVAQTQVWYDKEWFQGFNTKIGYVSRTLTPVGNYQYYYLDQKGDSAVQPFLRTSEIRITTRFAYQEKFIDGDFSRTSLGTKYPILQFTYIHSLKHIYEGQYDYQKVVLNVSDRVRWGLWGYTDYVIEGGQIFGNVPYPLLELHGGNQTFVYDYMAYNLMNYYEFASDRYASLWLFHHFEGLFFNKLPLVKKLKWREVVTYKVLFGSVSSNHQTLLFPTALHNLNSGPYQELSAGIENIFRFFRIDAFWRLNYTQYVKSPFGLKVGFQLSF
ncbi:MAG TPA: DUF5686 family protein [Bacteroidia bacterium]|nr:DUF5686 family protein [Bacteroidia bacterium]